jgi:hypothetical protein
MKITNFYFLMYLVYMIPYCDDEKINLEILTDL